MNEYLISVYTIMHASGGGGGRSSSDGVRVTRQTL